MSVQFRVISIGALGTHPLWEERTPQRADHATTVLVASGDERILVDPSLPPQLLEARMKDRTRIRPAEITRVFLTSFHPMRRRGLALFDEARWCLDARERDALQVSLQEKLEEADRAGDTELAATVRSELSVLGRCEPAPDHLAEGVDLFPMPGDTPGTCGLLLALPGQTVLVCGDAVATVEHLERGMVLPGAHDVKQAQTSFMEAVEIADLLVPGRDNLVLNPMRRF
jgi:glyoxylase-like metal-dependent hydrolase (beta-lactamase superfamily II)